MAKPGPKQKITPEVENRIIDILRSWGSVKDAAAIVGISTRTFRLHKFKYPEFSHRVKEAQNKAKMGLVKKVGKAKPWQAAAWMLERKYGAEYGRKDHVKAEITSKQTVEVIIVTEASACADEYEQYAGQRVGTEVLRHDRN